MDRLSKGLKSAILIAVLALYFALIWAGVSMADPQATTITNLSTDLGPTKTIQNRTDPGGSITTMNFDSVNQNEDWKAYVGNITGALVLQNALGDSIYEWLLDASSFSGAIYVTRGEALNWSALKCANRDNISNEETTLNMLAISNITRTFNYSVHKQLVTSITAVPSIAANTCNSTATFVNDTMQVIDATASFQEVLLSDESSLIYATFIDQDDMGFNWDDGANNATYDFQMILPDDSSTLYYFYADIT